MMISRNTPSVSSSLYAQNREKVTEKEKQYYRFLKQLEECGETEAERKQRLEAQKKEAEKRRAKQKRLMELNGRIAYLQSRIMMNPDDKAARGEIAMAKCQRYWVNFN